MTNSRERGQTRWNWTQLSSVGVHHSFIHWRRVDDLNERKDEFKYYFTIGLLPLKQQQQLKCQMYEAKHNFIKRSFWPWRTGDQNDEISLWRWRRLGRPLPLCSSFAREQSKCHIIWIIKRGQKTRRRRRHRDDINAVASRGGFTVRDRRHGLQLVRVRIKPNALARLYSSHFFDDSF
jgi:hypothetical protein